MNKRKSTNLIILHCSATKEGMDFKEKDIKQWHIQRGFETTGYHYVIDLDGTIESGRNESMVGAHCTGKNSTSIGICYIGGLDKNGQPKDTRTPQQKESMYKLVNDMLNKYKLTLDAVHCHAEFQNKSCPCFLRQTFINEFKDWKRHKNSRYIICPKCGEKIYLEQ